MNRELIRKKVNTENIRTKSQFNTLPIGWGISEIQTKINFKRKIVIEMPLIPKDECTEPDENIIGKYRIDPSYQKKKTKIRSPKGNPLFSWMFPLSKYEVWSCTEVLAIIATSRRFWKRKVALDDGFDKIWIGPDHGLDHGSDYVNWN